MCPPSLRGYSLHSFFLIQCLNTNVTQIVPNFVVFHSGTASPITVSLQDHKKSHPV